MCSKPPHNIVDRVECEEVLDYHGKRLNFKVFVIYVYNYSFASSQNSSNFIFSS